MSGTLQKHPPHAPNPAVPPAATSGEHRARRVVSGAVREPGRTPTWHRVREAIDELVGAFEEHDLLTYASAISFQIITAIVPFLLFVLALAGTFHLQSLWQKDLAPPLRDNVSGPFYNLIASSVNNVFSSQRLLWATAGGLIALWQASGAVRAVMGALNNIYRSETNRTFWRRLGISCGLAIVTAACFMLAALCIKTAPFFFSVRHHGPLLATIGFFIRWGLASVCLFAAVGLLVHFAPATPQPWRWVTLGSVIVIVIWLATTGLFSVYVSSIASYDSIFGGLSVIVVLAAYLYLSATAFLLGAQVDAMIRTEAEGTPAGAPRGFQRSD